MRGVSQLLPVLYSHTPPPVALPVIALQNNSLHAQPLVSQVIYFNAAGTAEILLATKPVKSSASVTPVRNEGRAALQQFCLHQKTSEPNPLWCPSLPTPFRLGCLGRCVPLHPFQQ